MSKVAAIGIVGESVFMTVEAFHKGGETVKANAIHKEFGGKGFNQAIAAKRYGAEVAFLGAVNADISQRCVELCRREELNGVFSIKQEQSSYAIILADRYGNNQVTVYQGACLTVADVESFREEIVSADVLLLNNETPSGVNLAACRIAKENDTKIIYNPAPARKLSKRIVELVDWFTPNEYEQAWLEDRNNLIITLGEKGCLIKSIDEKIPAYANGKVLDTTGAGDTFNGVLAACLAEGLAVRKACEIANRAAGIKVTRKYIFDSIPNRKEIENG